MTNEIVPTEVGQQAMQSKAGALLQKAQSFECQGIISARTNQGEHFSHDPDTGRTVMVAKGMVLDKKPNTVSVTVATPDASIDGVLGELSYLTQEQQGAFVGHSQPWVSQRRADD
ncbi:hypothetical protein [Cupriavidus sp. L7L]|uniref:hypothetical protein n=1 Tax=Cupriavidus sp. L7L TaxID=2546443 RepID=UPI001054685F|nr:hypothetical protein [Cupriavidus sp. L7L]TDF62055.1 hypothetical protein E1J61_31645 [Cupriavidus sp. L7L]